jgi:hypothetical protein
MLLCCCRDLLAWKPYNSEIRFHVHESLVNGFHDNWELVSVMTVVFSHYMQMFNLCHRVIYTVVMFVKSLIMFPAANVVEVYVRAFPLTHTVVI